MRQTDVAAFLKRSDLHGPTSQEYGRSSLIRPHASRWRRCFRSALRSFLLTSTVGRGCAEQPVVNHSARNGFGSRLRYQTENFGRKSMSLSVRLA